MDRNQSRVPVPKSGYAALAAGKNHSLGLLADADSDRIPDHVDHSPKAYNATEAECHPIGMGDADGDDVLDIRDFAELQNCFGGSHGSSGFDAPSQECLHLFDGNRDGDVDLLDYRWFRAAKFAG
jgi:hypothetical protein